MIRGCGTRVKGGVYIEVPLSKHGIPLEACLLDPPTIIDPVALGVSPIGIKLIEVNGVFHVFDWIGTSHYKNVADFIEEVRRFGLSRRIASNIDFSKITFESKIILIHEKAYIENWKEYESKCDCISLNPKVKKHHVGISEHEMCSRIWWEDLDEEVREMPAFEYRGKKAVVKGVYKPAIFAAFNIPRIVVVNDPEEGSHMKSLDKARNAKVPVKLVEE